MTKYGKGVAMRIEARLAELGIALPEVGAPMGNYVHAVRTGKLLFLAGKGPHNADGTMPKGKVGQDVSVEEAYVHARSVGLTLVAVLKQTLGDLDRVRQVVKVLGAAPDFGAQPAVINGCSDLFVEIFGDAGRHARSAVGMGSLPEGITVEIEAIVEIE